MIRCSIFLPPFLNVSISRLESRASCGSHSSPSDDALRAATRKKSRIGSDAGINTSFFCSSFYSFPLISQSFSLSSPPFAFFTRKRRVRVRKKRARVSSWHSDAFVAKRQSEKPRAQFFPSFHPLPFILLLLQLFLRSQHLCFGVRKSSLRIRSAFADADKLRLRERQQHRLDL